MSTITVSRRDAETYEVTVEADTRTTHVVRVEPEYHERLTRGRVTAEVLVERSFEFLLEREDNTQILSRFDLPVIGRYFPDYERVIAQRL